MLTTRLRRYCVRFMIWGKSMECLPDAIVQYILSHLNNARDVASCIMVSKQWKDSIPYITGLFFPRNIFDHPKIRNYTNTDEIILRLVSMVLQLEELVVYCPFSSEGLASCLSIVGKSLRRLELRMDNLSGQQTCLEHSIMKLDCIGSARNLESLNLWGVLMTRLPKWDVFQNLQNLEIVGARMEDHTLANALQLFPNLTRLLLLGCEGVKTISIQFDLLEECRLEFYGYGDNSLFISCPKLTTLEIQSCGWIKARKTNQLRNLSIANSGGKVFLVDFEKLAAVESLSLRGVQWTWDAISKMLQWASEVKHLFMKVEFTGDFGELLPFPEINFVEFFNSHPKLQRFDIHGAMFAALCHENNLISVNSRFSIPCLEEVVITVRSPLNAEQKMSTLESFMKYARNLKKMVIKVLLMKSSHSSSDDFFEEIWRFRFMHREIVRIA